MSNLPHSTDRHKVGKCCHCEEEGKIVGRGLCKRCYGYGDIRNSYSLILERVPWSDYQLRQIFYLRRSGLNIKEVALRVGRSYFSVKEALSNHVDASKSASLTEISEDGSL